MATLAELQTRLAALERALASGHKSVSYGEHRVDYRSIDELKAAMLHVQSEIASVTGRRVVRGYRFVPDKAL